MRRFLWFTAAAVFLLPSGTWSQQSGSPDQGQNQAQSAPAPQQDSLAEAARKAREQKKEAPKTAKTFTNDNIPTQGGISSVGEGTAGGLNDTTAAPPSGKAANDEKTWREKFAFLHHKLEQDQANLDVMQRELGQLNTQFYTDPTKGMQQGFTRSDINNKVADINRMKAQIEADKQAISDAEDELRKSGGDSGWAR